MTELDRLAPGRRPDRADQPVAGTQTWSDLLFLHWRVDPNAVQAHLPAGLTVDTQDGSAWVGLVPFSMRAVRPSWLPRAFAFDFLECNVRTYVHAQGQPGVWFGSLDAASWLGVQAARWQWGLPYFYAEMHTERTGARIRYESLRQQDGAKFIAEYTPGDELGASVPGTLEHFLLERYYLFATHRGRLVQGQVHHPPYVARRAELHRLEETIGAAAGFDTSGPPELVHFSDGVDIEAFGPWALTAQ